MYFFKIKDKIDNNYIHHLSDVEEKFLKNEYKLDLNEIKRIESKYTNFCGLNEQLPSSQYTSTPYHDRHYFKATSYEENLYWLILHYNKTEKLLDDINPDYIFDLDTPEIQRTILNEIANYRGIPYITPEFSRYDSYILPSFTIGKLGEKYFIDAFKKIEKKKQS